MPPATTATVLRALADLAPAAPERVFDVVRGGAPLIWLDDPQRCPRHWEIDRLAAMDLLHRDERILRRAWGLVIGTGPVGGATDGGAVAGGTQPAAADAATRRIRLPLVVEPVRLDRTSRGYRVIPAGDLELTPLIEDRALAARLESAPGLGSPGWLDAPGTEAWLRSVAEAAGLSVCRVERNRGPARGHPAEGLVLYAAAALFPIRDGLKAAVVDRLRVWASRDGLDSTALAAVYGVAGSDGAGPAGSDQTDATDATDEVRSPLPLTQAQTEVVRRARGEAVTVVSGPPGNGKSHAIVAAAMEVVNRGGSVLVVTQSVHAADVLGELFDRYPGPPPLLFGNARRRAGIAAMLSPNGPAPVDPAVLAADRAAVRAATADVARLTARIGAELESERLATAARRWEPVLSELRADVPGVFEPDADLDQAWRLLTAPAGADWSRWRRGWHSFAVRRLRRRLRVRVGLPPDRLGDAIEAARAVAARARLATTGGTELGSLWSELAAAHDTLATTIGTAMAHQARSGYRWDAAARRSASGLAAALRAGRERRRELLAALDGDALVRALPLWVGTVTDVEDLLPPTPGLFDLVILDEASHTDQIRAAPVLARARRALVVGDPRQLRFVSFVADVDVATTLDQYGLDGRLDVRRVSAFDLAAGAAPVVWLDEHFRCVPHLIEFSARRFYGDRIAVATRHPRNEAMDAIDEVAVTGATTEKGVNQAEVAAAVAVVRDLAAQGGRDIGLITPFRSQADAIEAALLEEFPVTEIEQLGLRVGTVHSFQGSEADTVLVCLTVTDDDPPGRVRFVTDPNLFNVMVTRARRRILVLNSLTQPGGLIGDYLRHGDLAGSGDGGAAMRGPDPVSADAGIPGGAARSPEWPDRLAAELIRIGVPVRRDYQVGRWRLDLCVGPATEAVGLVCAVHPEGPAAHIARHLALRTAGWSLVEAYPSRWDLDPVRAALDIAVRFTPVSEVRPV